MNVRPFRPSLRETFSRLALLGFGTFVVLRLLLGIPPHFAALATVTTAAVMLAWKIAAKNDTRLQISDGGLSIDSPDGQRSIAWSTVEHVQLAAGEIETERGIARIPYARVDLAHGPPVAFADLSRLEDTHVTLPDARTAILNVAEPEIAFGIIADRIDAQEFLPPTEREPQLQDRLASSLARSARTGSVGSSQLFALRGALLAIVLIRTAAVLFRQSGNVVTDAASAVALVLIPWIGAAIFSWRWPNPARRSSLNLLTWMLSVSLALSAHAMTVDTSHPAVGRWALVTAMVLTLPIAPLPGVSLARWIGRSVATTTSDRYAAALIVLFGTATAMMFALGLSLLSFAAIAGMYEGGMIYLATLRQQRLAQAPRFQNWAPEFLAQMRATLRASYLGPGAPQTAAMDLLEARRAFNESNIQPPHVAIKLFAILVGLSWLLWIARGSGRMDPSSVALLRSVFL
jgi:hypothetical protein